MKILYYSTAYFASHGGSNHSKSFVECARKNSDVSELIVFPSKSTLKKPMVAFSGEKEGSFLTVIKDSSLATILRFLRVGNFYLEELFEVVRTQQPDAVIMRLSNNFIQVSKLKKKFPGLIVATEVNASPFDESFKGIGFRSFFRRLERKHLSNADLNFFVSNTLRKKIMQSLCDRQRDFVLPNGVDTILFQPSPDKVKSKQALGLPTDKKVIGYVGTLDISKRMDLLIKAFAAIHKIREDVYFVIVGDGPAFTTTKSEVITSGLQDVTRLTGNVEHARVPEYLQTFDLAVHHAANDYMCPLKLFEYLAVEVPVIGPDTTAVKEIFDEGKHMFFCEPSVESIVEKLTWCLNNFDGIHNVAKEGLKLVYEKYTWQINADTVVEKIKIKKGQ